VATFRSILPHGESLSKSINFIFNKPREFSYLGVTVSEEDFVVQLRLVGGDGLYLVSDAVRGKLRSDNTSSLYVCSTRNRLVLLDDTPLFVLGERLPLY